MALCYGFIFLYIFSNNKNNVLLELYHNIIKKSIYFLLFLLYNNVIFIDMVLFYFFIYNKYTEITLK